MGNHPARIQHGRFFNCFWAFGENTERRNPLPHLFLRCIVAVDIFFNSNGRRHPKSNRKCELNHEGLFSKTHHSSYFCSLGSSGFHDCFQLDGLSHGVVSNCSGIDHSMPSASVMFNGSNRIWSRNVVVRSGHSISGCEICRSILIAIVDVRSSSSMAHFADPAKIQAFVRFIPDGWSDRGISFLSFGKESNSLGSNCGRFS